MTMRSAVGRETLYMGAGEEEEALPFGYERVFRSSIIPDECSNRIKDALMIVNRAGGKSTALLAALASKRKMKVIS